MNAVPFARWVASIVLVAAAVVSSSPAPAQAVDAARGPAAEALPAKLPAPLTKDAIRELVSRLSDTEVRRLLIDQLDRGAALPADAGADLAGIVGAVDSRAGDLRARGAELFAAAGRLPAAARNVVARLTERGGAMHLLVLAVGLLAMVGVGWALERLYRRLVGTSRGALVQAADEALAEQASRIALRVVLETVGLALFAAGGLGLFFALYQGHAPSRTVVLTAFFAVLIYRGVALTSRFLLAPHSAGDRLLPFDDAAARLLHSGVLRFTLLLVIFAGAANIFAALGGDPAVADLLRLASTVVLVASLLETTWRARGPIGALIARSAGGGPSVRLLGEIWPVLATLLFVVIASARAMEILEGKSEFSGIGVFTLLVLIALPIIDMALCRVLHAAVRKGQAAAVEGRTAALVSYEPLLRRAIHIVVTVLGFLVLAGVWDLDLFALAQKGLGERISSALVGIAIVLLLAYILWEATRTAVERRMSEEAEIDSDHPASRLRTLLPLLRITLQIAILVMATLSILAALGVDILPLLAGASIVGVAIGFGSQTLVRDVVSGAFFLMDDSFRLGEYLEVGDAKGRVEKITVRSLFLRHHRGALNILPYGEIKRLRNNSRDWMIMVMEFRLTYDTDLKKVKKILKKIGEELAADPDYGPDMLQPLKSQGVMSTEDSALVVRAKYMAKPGTAPFMIRRAAYDRILKAFAEEGIKFAHRQVTVYVPPTDDEESDDKARAAAGAAVAAALPAAAGKPAA